MRSWSACVRTLHTKKKKQNKCTYKEKNYSSTNGFQKVNQISSFISGKKSIKYEVERTLPPPQNNRKITTGELVEL